MIDESKIVEEVASMTTEEKAEAWATWVRKEINAALDIYLDKAKTGHINVKYYPHLIETLETGDVYDEKKADGVLLSIIFEFEEPIVLE